MPNLLYVPRFDRSGAGPRYRVYQFIGCFQALGIEITDKPLFDAKYLKNLYFNKKRSIFDVFKAYLKRGLYLVRHKNKFDLVLMDGELFPFIPYFIEKLFLPRHYIIDQDDAIFHTYDNHRSWLVRKLLGNKIANVWKRSSHVIVSNSYIKEKALLMGVKQISILPTVVNETQYKPLSSVTFPDKQDAIVIGWVGSPTTIDAMDLIKESLIKISKKSNIILCVIGANYEIENVKTICEDWKEGWNENKEIILTNKIDIGIMPLVNGPYQNGKGGFKLIKYMACEKPIIASPVGVNIEIIDHGENGYLASTQDEWEKYLLDLIDNPERRIQFGKNGRKKMVDKYSYQYVNNKICKIIKDSIANAI